VREFSPEEAFVLFARVKPIALSLSEKLAKLRELEAKSLTEVDPLERMFLKTLLKELSVQIKRHKARIEELGGVVVKLSPLFISFPAQVKGRRVWLSWREGEEELSYWYEEGEGVEERKPLKGLF